MNRKSAFVLAALLCLSSAALRAEEPKPDAKKKGTVERLYARGPELEKLKAELQLTDEQLQKMKDAVSAIEKKNSELTSQSSVQAAEEEVKKAKEALKAAEAKLSLTKEGFDLNEERKKAAYETLPDDKKEKAQDLLHYRPKVAKKKD